MHAGAGTALQLRTGTLKQASALSPYPPEPSIGLAASQRNFHTANESYDIYDPPTSPQQRQQRQQPRSQQSQSRPSSSSGSTHTLRRTPRLDPRSISRGRTRSASRSSQSQFAARTLQPILNLEGSTTPGSFTAQNLLSPYWPKRSTRISKHTANAIRYALEAIRGDPEGTYPVIEGQPLPRWTPKPFTPDHIELNAQMSDLLEGGVSNGRTQNGGSRATVPQPFAEEGGRRLRTPTDVMRERINREARKKAESDRQRREEERQTGDTGDTGPTAVAAGGAVSVDTSGYRRSSRKSGGDPTSQEPGERRPGDRGSGGTRANIPSTTQAVPYGSANANGRTEKTSSAPQDVATDVGNPPQPRTRTRGATLSTGQPRPVETKRQGARAASASATMNTQPGSSAQTRNTSAKATTGTSQPRGDLPGASSTGQQQPRQEPAAGSQDRRPTTSSFPHAFERWETLSSHWEGLTSFWIHRLEQNKEDIDRDPINQQMARQVTDLSAAGANLFHAVVELQRLRASSERKFQRWFFETRAEQERFRENQGKFDERLREEREAREAAVEELARLRNEESSVYSQRRIADIRVKEMTRELAIAKDEARRAWEELGRREQVERDRTISLQRGQITTVGGVQVVPMVQGGASRQGSTNRPSEGAGASTTSRQTATRLESPVGDDRYTNYDPARSETDTDPFTEGGRANPQQSEYREPDRPITATTTTTTTTQPYQQTSNTSAAAVQAARAASSSASQSNSQPSRNTAASAPAASAPGGTYLRYGPDVNAPATTQPATSSFYQHEGTALHGQARVTEADERSYVQSIDDTLSEEDYDLDENGEIRRDSQGRPILGRRVLGSEGSDEYDVQEALERERMYGRSYGSSMSGVEYGSGPPAVSGRQGPAAPADYTGSGFGAGWEAMPRHHHPTRLSDVLEEDERSRTSPSRASQTSRGIR